MYFLYVCNTLAPLITSPLLHHMYTTYIYYNTCTLHLHHMYKPCTRHIYTPYVHTLYTPHVHTICTHHVHTICTHHVNTTCTLHVHHIYTTCIFYYTICTSHIHHMYSVHHMYTTCILFFTQGYIILLIIDYEVEWPHLPPS